MTGWAIAAIAIGYVAVGLLAARILARFDEDYDDPILAGVAVLLFPLAVPFVAVVAIGYSLGWLALWGRK